MTKPLYIGAIDIGSNKIKGMIAKKQRDSSQIEVLSLREVPSFGVRKGIIVDKDKVCQKVLELKNLLIEENQKELKEVFVNIGGYHIFVKQTSGAIAISRADQKVSQEDIERVIEASRSLTLPFNKEVLEVVPKEFIIDGERGIKNPLNLKGIKLEVESLAICAFSPYVKNLIDAILCADLEIAEIIPSPIAASIAVLTPQQKELGVALVDIGAGSTSIAVFEEGGLIHLAILPVGSSHISNDIAIALQTEIEIAEKIKLKFGEYIFKKSRRKEKIEIKPNQFFTFSLAKMANAGKARVSEILGLIKKELKKIGKLKSLPAGVVLTGGGSNLKGIVDFAKKETGLPTKKVSPKGFINLQPDPSLSVLCGLILKGFEEESEEKGSKFFEKIKKVFRVFLP
ncbi:MAG: cell division protein FtsA [Candidatus Pacebacteria bacterium]|nr:cell division protein FtsA [Candidatus Paceibacterota bacterium]